MVKEKNGRVEIRSVEKKFTGQNGNEMLALCDVNLTVEPEEFVTLIGPSGCGKTTLLRLICGLEKPSDGNLYLDGEQILGTSSERGLVFQNPELFMWMNIENNVAFGLKARKIFKENKSEVQKYIELVGLNGFEKSYPHQLSGGMAQRASLARTLINQPKVLLLDEPFGALDAFTRLDMQQKLLDIWIKQRMTMIMVTHDVDEAVLLSSRIIVMSPRPARIKEVIQNELPRPRDRNSVDFLQLRRKVYNLLDFNAVDEFITNR